MPARSKKKMSCYYLIKSSDIFGATVDFSFRNSQRFGTNGGLFVSLIIVFFMLFYSILIILDSVKFSKPYILNSYKNLINTETYNITTNFPSDIIKSDPKSLELNINKNDKTFSNPHKIKKQISFALYNLNTNQFIPYDPSYFIINGFVIDEKKESALMSHVELCEENNFAYASNKTFANLQMGKSYCFHSDFYYRDTYPSNSGMYKGFEIKVKRCVNNTYSYVAKESMPAYERLKFAFDSMLADAPMEDSPSQAKPEIKSGQRILTTKKNKRDNYSVFNKSTSYNEANNNKNKSFKNITIKKETRQTLEETINSNTDASSNTINMNILHSTIANSLSTALNSLVCQSADKIESQIANIKLIIFYNNFLLNSTQDSEPVIPKVDINECSLSKTLLKEKILYFSYVTLKTQNSLIPQSLSDQSDFKYYLNLESENIIYGDANINSNNNNNNQTIFNPNKMEDLDFTNENLISVKFALYNYKLEITRRYRDIFEIMGNIGGLSKILMLIGFCLITYYARLRKKEALINELYTNKASLSINGFKEMLKKNLECIDLDIIKKINAYCVKEFIENGGEEMQKRHNSESKHVIISEVNIDEANKNHKNEISNADNEDNVSSNKPSEENDIIITTNNAFSREQNEEDSKKVNSLFKRIYLEFCDSQNSEIKDLWSTPDRNRKKEFYNRVFCRAFVKFYFMTKAQQLGLGNYLKSENKEINLNNHDNNKNDNKNINDNTKNNNLNTKNNILSWNNVSDFLNNTLIIFESNQAQQINFLASMMKYINDHEVANYKSLVENIDRETAAKFRFEIYEFCCLICCRVCSTSKFKKRCKEFDTKYEEFLEQTDFNEIINSMQEFKTFKKTFFEKGQLWLFNSCPIKAITYEDYEENKNANFLQEKKSLHEEISKIFNY